MRLVVLFAVTTVVAFGGLHYIGLRHKLDLCRAENTALQARANLQEQKVATLRSLTDEQSKQVQLLGRMAELRQKEVLATRAFLDEMRAEQDEAVERLEKIEGKTCEDGVRLIEQELGL